MKAHVLIVDDERLIRLSLERAVEHLGHHVKGASSFEEAEAAIAASRYELVILDLRLGNRDGMDLLRRLRAEARDTKVIVITAHGNVTTAVAAMKLGAYDFVNKPFELDELLATVSNALRASALERRVEYHEKRERDAVDALWEPGRSADMARLDREIASVAAQPVPVVLITGETGSGKAVIARRLHLASNRSQGPFVELNAAAIPENLVETELFGHEKGAFSDARERKLGLVEVADGGTLLLDEVGELGTSAQAKLLTFIESFSFRRVGGTTARSVDVRLIAATNRDLAARVREGLFREDLYYRLSSLVLHVPALREHRDDIAPLALHFLRADATRFRKRFRSLSADAARVLAAWRWPGNVRELKAVIQRAVLMNDAEELRPEHLPPDLLAASVDPIPSDLLSQTSARLPTLEEIELRYMKTVLELSGGNKVKAAERLGITRQTLAKRLGHSD